MTTYSSAILLLLDWLSMSASVILHKVCLCRWTKALDDAIISLTTKSIGLEIFITGRPTVSNS